MYKAIEEIGEYKVGDEVPTDKAELWMVMYKKSPVEKIIEEVSSSKPVKVEKKKESSVESSVPNAMYDDYIDRNSRAVIKAIRDDNLNEKVLKDLLLLESNDKNRKKVIKEIELKIKSIN